MDNRDYQKNYYKTHREQMKDRVRKYHETHRKEDREYKKEHPEQLREYNKKFRLEHPEIVKADNLAYYHCPLGSVCEFGSCGSTKNLQRAHMDYDYPLEVLTFCAKHHSLVDRLYRRFD